MTAQDIQKSTEEVPVEYQLLTYDEIKDSPLLPKIVKLINHAFRTHNVPLFPDAVRYGSTEEFLETLGSDGFMVAALAKDDEGVPYPVAVSGGKPWTRGGDYDYRLFGLNDVHWHRQVVPQLRSDFEWEIVSSAVLYADERFHRRGLVNGCNKRVYEEAYRRSKDGSVTCVCVGTEYSRDYWLKNGYTITDEALVVKGSWGSSRDFMFYLLQQKMR